MLSAVVTATPEQTKAVLLAQVSEAMEGARREVIVSGLTTLRQQLEVAGLAWHTYDNLTLLPTSHI